MSGIICLNPGSSSLKWAVFKTHDENSALLSGSIALEDAASSILAVLQKYNVSIAIIRFVHGGFSFHKPVEITNKIFIELMDLEIFAPLHIRESLRCCKIINTFQGKIRQIAVFDTELFQDLPESAQLYGLSKLLLEKYKLRRFGFHGFAHAGMLATYMEMNPNMTMKARRVVTLQMGSGCSMAAFLDGKPIDTTMGFTPNDGLLMSTRCGDIDPGLVTWLQRQENWTPDETDKWLNERSGWAGLSGESDYISILLSSNKKSSRNAIYLMVHRIRKALGAYYAILGGVDAILLSGGIAENALQFCHSLLNKLEHLGISLSASDIVLKNNTLTERYCSLSSPESEATVWVIQNSEFNMMIRSAKRLIPEGDRWERQ